MRTEVDWQFDAKDLRPATRPAGDRSDPAATAVPDYGPSEVDRSQTVGEVAFAVLRKHFQTFLRSEPGTRIGDDPEQVHDMRVATRRMRAALSIFREALPVRSARMRSELGWIADALGAVRDLDVQIQRVRRWVRQGLDGDGGAEVVALLEEARGAARNELLGCLRSARFASFVDAFGAMLRQGPLPAQRLARTPIIEAAPDLIAGRRRAVQRALKRPRRGEAEAPALHQVRIKVKRLRYCLEFLADVHPREIGDLLPGLVRTQDLLGAHHDSVVGGAALRALASVGAAEIGPASLFALGRMSQRYDQEARRAARRFANRGSPIKGRGWKRLRQAAREGQRTGDGAQPAQAAFEV